MRRDLGFYLEADIATVYNAYLKTLMAPPFGRSCKETPYHSLTFGLNFSMKYNMNGGACHIHFMPSGTGTAVNMRFTVAQAAGARYGRYAEEIHRNLVKHLQVPPIPARYNMDDFLRPENQVTPQTASAPVTPVAPAPAPAPAPTPVAAPVEAPYAVADKPRFCTGCGTPLDATMRFCTRCGKPASSLKTCPRCNTTAKDGDAFCRECGTRL